MNLPVAIRREPFQAAFSLAQVEGKLVGQVIEPFLIYTAGQSSADAYRLYTVQSGDSLGTIARHFYGDPYKYPLIQQANNMAHPGQLWVGLVVVIPPVAAPQEAAFYPAMGQGNIESELAAVLALEDEWAKAGALAELAPYLSTELVDQALFSAQQIEDDWAQAKALAVLSVRLAEVGNVVGALTTIRSIKRDWNRSEALVDVVPHLPRIFHTDALTIAHAISRPEIRSAALVGMSPYLSGGLREDALRGALNAIEAIESGPLQAEARTEVDARLAEFGYQSEWLLALQSQPSADGPESEFYPVTQPTAVQQSKASVAGNVELRGQTGQILGLTATKKSLAWLVPVLIVFGCIGMLLGGVIAGGVALVNQDPALERIEVPGNGHSVITRMTLQNGELYSIVVSGLFNYNVEGTESWADAQSSYYNQQRDWITNYWISIDGQKVIAQLANADNHQYIFFVQGNNRPLKFRIEERRETDYENNDGFLEVAIYSGLVEWQDIQ